MEKRRLERAESIVGDLVREYFQNILPDYSDTFGIISILHVKISHDTAYTDIYVSAFKNQDDLCKNLAEHAQKIQRIIAKKTKILKIPKLRFRYDDSGEKIAHISGTLSQIQHEEKN